MTQEDYEAAFNAIHAQLNDNAGNRITHALTVGVLSIFEATVKPLVVADAGSQVQAGTEE